MEKTKKKEKNFKEGYRKGNMREVKMKKTLTIFMTIAALMGTSIFAQSSADVTASAAIVSAASISTDSNVDFGDVLSSPAGTPTLNPIGGGSHSNVAGTQTLGQVTITGYDGASISVSVNKDSTALSDGAGNWIRYNPSYSEYTTNTQSSATSLSLTNASPATVNLSGTTNHYIWLGGTLTQLDGVTDLSGQTAGTYTSTAGSGSITLSVAYN